MSQLSDTLLNVAARLEKFDEEAILRLEAIQGSDITRELLGVVAALTHVNPTPEFNAVVTLLKAFVPPQADQPSYTPAGPQVAGQA